ncbi:DNA polymerase II [Ferrimonas gelatinilytica]|uniref:DNA polymerase n=1 Tax=Ferrimonas gelatinilytica TaxID=1255257 RepID=A0ABP9RY21_9GAMM
MDRTSIYSGWILSREQRSGPRGVELIYWLSTSGGPVCLTLPDQPHRGYVLAQQKPQWQTWLGSRQGWQWQSVPATDFEHRPVWALDIWDSELWQQCRRQSQAQGWPLLESDIAPQERYLMERFIRAGMAAKVKDHRILAARHAVPSHAPSMVSLDIECSREGELYSIGLYSDSAQRVWMIGEARPGPDYLTFVADEVTLLRSLLDWFERADPDVIIGWSVAQFDIRLLQKRAQHHGLRLALGRDGSEPRWEERAGPGRGCAISGRLILDGIEWLKAAFYQFDSFALDAVANALLGEGKACQQPEDRMGEIEHNFHHDPLALAHYNLKDCELVWRIFEKTQLLPFVLARGQMTGLALDRLGGSVAAFTFRYLPLLHRSGYVAPDLTTHEIPPSPGGYVMDSVPGKYRNVLVLDFKSLYPSIIRSYLIDPMGMLAAQQAPDADSIEGFRGARFHRQQHQLPALIAELAEQREAAKGANDQPLSQAIKILMNSFYGVLGAAGCRFHDPRLASSITLRGHEIMKRSRALIEAEGASVIYGDTDSLFVHVGDDCPPSRATAWGQALVERVNAYWQDTLSQLGLTSALELEFETQFDHFFMPTLRGALTGSKKRYVGAVADGDALTLVFKGMETVRSDWTEMARRLQRELYQAWFMGKPVAPLVKRWVARIRNGECDELLLYRKRLRRPLEEYQAQPPHVLAARRANALLNQPRYRKGSVIGYYIGVNGAFPKEERNGELDREHYVDKQLRPVVEPVLAACDLTLNDLDSDQLGLF